MTPLMRETADLAAKGYSTEAIACLLGVPVRVVLSRLSNLRIHARVPPPGYLTLREASKATGVPLSTLSSSSRKGYIKTVRIGKGWFVTIEAVQNYINGVQGVDKAKEYVKRLFQGRSKPA